MRRALSRYVQGFGVKWRSSWNPRIGPRLARSANNWIPQHWASVVLNIFVQYALRTFWLLIFPIYLVEHDGPVLLDGGPHDQSGLCAAGWLDHRGQIWNSVEHLPPSH